MDNQSIRIVLADDHNLIRAGIRSLLENVPWIEIIAEASNGLEALALVAAYRPDIILIDIAMPGMGGLDVAARLRTEFPETRVVILTMHHDEEYVRRAITVGAVGYLMKDANIEELHLVLQAVGRGETYLSPAASKHLINEYLRRTSLGSPGHLESPVGTCSGMGTVGSGTGLAGTLTLRQREVLRLIAQGQNTKTIGRQLGISAKTVESHRTQLMERLDIHDVAGLVRFAIRQGLITSEE